MPKTVPAWLPQSIPSGYVNIAIEAMAIEIVSFPIKNGGSFQFVM